MNTETRNCRNCKQPFTIEPADFGFYEKMQVPAPTWCPECRLQRRLYFMNERALYKRNCDLCGKSIVNMYSPDKNLKVYCNPCWWSDKWDSLSYGREYDPARPFLAQLKELYEATPQMALEVNYPTLVNSDYVNHAATAKNCYLIFTADECENVMYSEIISYYRDCLDCTRGDNLELCCGTINSARCNRCFFSEYCTDSNNLVFCNNCRGCNDCFGCVNLRNKKYHIFNQPHSKEEYEKKLAEMRLDARSGLAKARKQAHDFWLTQPNKYIHSGARSVNVSGDYVNWSKNAHDCYMVVGAEDSRYCQLLTMRPTRDAYDYTIWGNNAQKIYECMIVGEGADTVKFSFQCWPNVRDVEYSMFAISSSHLFGCANVRNKQHCILNKQYSPEEYGALKKRIIEDMGKNPFVDPRGRVFRYGEFLPYEISLFGYNESYAADFFPLDKAEAERQGFACHEPEPNPHKPTLRVADVPDSIRDVPDSILNDVIACGSCGKPFRILSVELGLLRRFGLPVLGDCPDCRYRSRFVQLNPPRLWDRVCGKCGTAIRTAYAPDRPEIVYCEKCFNAAIA